MLLAVIFAYAGTSFLLKLELPQHIQWLVLKKKQPYTFLPKTAKILVCGLYC